MGEVISFNGDTSKIDSPDVDAVLENAKGQLSGFVIAGYDKNGDEFFASTYGSIEKTNFLADRMKHMIMQMEDSKFADSQELT